MNLLPIKNMRGAPRVTDKKKGGRNAVTVCFFTSFMLLCSAYLPHTHVQKIQNKFSRIGFRHFHGRRIREQKWENPEPSWSITCDRSHFEYDLCYINRAFVLDPKNTMLSSADPTGNTPLLEEKIKLYPRKWQHNAMETVKVLTLTTAPLNLPCTIAHGTPALVFSTYPMNVDPTLQRGPNPKTIIDFHDMLTSTYKYIDTYPLQLPSRPRLVLIGRTNPRVIVNQDQVVEAAKNIGFDVVVFEPNRDTPSDEVYKVVHNCHAMIGVHGAGLTNELFLRTGAVFMQIVPIRCSWLGDICYGKLAVRLKLEYFTYDVVVKESSLAGKYPREMLDGDKGTMIMNDWSLWDIYMEQNVTINLDRFGRYLEKVYDKAKIFMEKESFKNKLLL